MREIAVDAKAHWGYDRALVEDWALHRDFEPASLRARLVYVARRGLRTPGTGTSTWTDIPNDIGDQPVNDVVYDAKTGDAYASTDFTLLKRASGTTT